MIINIMETDIFDKCINVIWIEADPMGLTLYTFINTMNVHITIPPKIYGTTRI